MNEEIQQATERFKEHLESGFYRDRNGKPIVAKEDMSEEMTKQDAIERLAALWDNRYPLQCKAIDMAITALSAEPMRWIPVSERLPEDSGEYLVSVIDGSGEDNDYEAVGEAWFAHKKDYNIKESEWRQLGIDETVIAWMPKPAPFETESEEQA